MYLLHYTHSIIFSLEPSCYVVVESDICGSGTVQI